MHAHRAERGQDLTDPEPRKLGPGERVELLRQLGRDPGTDECISPLGNKATLTNTKIDGQNLPGARALWVLTYGDPGDLFVLHTCGSGEHGCLNVRHLYLGTHKQNMLDRGLDGNWAAAKLSPSIVREIRKRLATGEGQSSIAADFGVDASQISSIKIGRTWAWVED